MILHLSRQDVKGRETSPPERKEESMAWVVILAFAVVAFLAVTAGADTSDGDDWATHPRL
jgi:hypothetical protein